MPNGPATRPSLLLRIRNSDDRQAWSQFVEVYAPVVYRFARRRGLQDADAADVTQNVLRAVAGAAPRLDYDRTRGSFRGWLYTVSRNKLNSFLASERRQARGGGDPSVQRLLENQPAPAEDVDLWQQEYERGLFAWAADVVRGTFQEPTWKAFWETAVEGRSAREVAVETGMSPGAVYIAKSRVLARLRERIAELEGDDRAARADETHQTPKGKRYGGSTVLS